MSREEVALLLVLVLVFLLVVSYALGDVELRLWKLRRRGDPDDR